jgi:DNA-directed RNA polymerase specialized sigma24 family protein
MSDEQRAKWLKRLMALGINHEDAEDLLQDAFVEVCEYLYRLHPEATPEIMQNLMTDALIGFRLSSKKKQ